MSFTSSFDRDLYRAHMASKDVTLADLNQMTPEHRRSVISKSPALSGKQKEKWSV